MQLVDYPGNGKGGADGSVLERIERTSRGTRFRTAVFLHRGRLCVKKRRGDIRTNTVQLTEIAQFHIDIQHRPAPGES
jgi:hypothetical protein